MPNEAARLDQALKAAGVPIIGVSLGSLTDKSTWKVCPASLQAQAQPTIDAFDPNAQSVVDAELDAQAQQRLDMERIFSAIVWTILDTYSATAPATITKYNSARTKIIAAYKAQPWKP